MPTPGRWEGRPPHQLTPAAAGRLATRQGHDETDTPGPPPQTTTDTDHAGTVGRQTAWRTPRGPAPAKAGRTSTRRCSGGIDMPGPPPRATFDTDHTGEALWCQNEVLQPWRHALRTPVEQGTRHRRVSPPRCTDGPRRLVVTRDHGHASGMTVYAPDTCGGGTLAPSSARLPTHSRRAEPNAALQAPPIAAARDERRLLAVACKRLLGRPQSSGVWRSDRWQQ